RLRGAGPRCRQFPRLGSDAQRDRFQWVGDVGARSHPDHTYPERPGNEGVRGGQAEADALSMRGTLAAVLLAAWIWSGCSLVGGRKLPPLPELAERQLSGMEPAVRQQVQAAL